MTTIVICLGTKSIMSLVRMCTVTVSLFRMCVCMCLRARERQRRETSSKGSDADLVPALHSSKDECMEKGERKLSITAEHLQLSEKPFRILAGLSLHPFLEANDLKSIVGPYSPKRQVAECKGPLKEEPLVWVERTDKVDGQLICSPAVSAVPTQTIAWSDCVVESTSCIAYHHQQVGDGKLSLEVVKMEEQLKTLVDELLETDRRECPTEFACSCQCSQLPNQILTTLASSCTI